MAQKLKIAQQALEDIQNPIGKMRRELREGYELNGAAASALARGPEHLKKIARDALTEIVGTDTVCLR